MKRCKKCNKNFLITIDRTTFCSHRCQAQWAITLANKAKKPRPRRGITLNCIVCKKEFYVPQYRAKKQCTKYCSRSCLAKKHLAPYVKIHGFKKVGQPIHTYKEINVNGRRIKEHRYIMEQHLGKKLTRNDHVHHINGNPHDNRIENLEVLSNSEHQKKELSFRKKLLLIRRLLRCLLARLLFLRNNGSNLPRR